MGTWLLLAVFLVAPHTLLAQNRHPKVPTLVPISAISIVDILDSSRTLHFFLLGHVHESCLSQYGYTLKILKEDSDYWIQATASKEPGKKCKSGDFLISAYVPFSLMARHRYTFRFWQSDSKTLDTTFVLH